MFSPNPLFIFNLIALLCGQELFYLIANVIAVFQLHAMMTAEQETLGHDSVGICELFQVLSVHGMTRYIARKTNSRLNMIILQECEQLKAMLTHECNGHPILFRVVYGQNDLIFYLFRRNFTK
jgi:hypothetical protein